MNPKQLLWGLLIASLLSITGFAIWAGVSHHLFLPKPPSSQELPVLGKVPTFQLTDQSNQPFHSRVLENQVWIADFIFTSCAGNCPLMTDRMAKLANEFPEVRFISVSVDPKRDTPNKLTRYARKYGADHKQWTFLTGKYDRIKALSQKGFRLGIGPSNDPKEPIMHSFRFVLVDGNYNIRGYYDSSDPKRMAQLKSDVRTLIP